MKGRVCVCIAGWHLPGDFFQSLRQIREADPFVVCHQPRAKIPAHVFESVPEDRVFAAPNIGYDWGCFQQFIETGRWKDYDAVAFMHDDMHIVDPGLFVAGLERLRKHAILANGRVEQPRAWTDTHPESYIHSSWFPPRGYVHDVVRGSFFMMARRTLEQIRYFDVFWDRYGISSFFGNWSTRASCARWQNLFGGDCFGFFSQTGCISDFIVEHIRGVDARSHEEMRTVTAEYLARTSAWKKWVWERSIRWSRAHVQKMWDAEALSAVEVPQSLGARWVLQLAARSDGRII